MAAKIKRKILPASCTSAHERTTPLSPSSSDEDEVITVRARRNSSLEVIVLPDKEEVQREPPPISLTRTAFTPTFAKKSSDANNAERNTVDELKFDQIFNLHNIPYNELSTPQSSYKQLITPQPSFEELITPQQLPPYMEILSPKESPKDIISPKQSYRLPPKLSHKEIISPKQSYRRSPNQSSEQLISHKESYRITPTQSHKQIISPKESFRITPTQSHKQLRTPRSIAPVDKGVDVVRPNRHRGETISNKAIKSESKINIFPKFEGAHDPNQSSASLEEENSSTSRTFSKLRRQFSDEQGSYADEKLTQFFNLYDKDGSGCLSYDELKAALYLESDGDFSDEEFRQLLDRWDEERTQSIDLAQFRRLIVNFRGLQLKKTSHKIRRYSDQMPLESEKGSCHFVSKALILMCRVRIKWLLTLLCVVVCVVLAPLITLAHNGMHPNDIMFGFTQGLQWVLTPWIGLGHWALAYPRRRHPMLVGLIGSVAMACGIPVMLLMMCDGSEFMLVFDMESQKSTDFLILGWVGVPLVGASFWVWMAMYHGPVHHKWVFVLMAILPVFVILYKVVTHLPLDLALVRALTVVSLLGGLAVFMVAACFGGHVCFKRPKLIEGGQRAFIGIAAFGLPYLTLALVKVFANTWMADSSLVNNIRTPLWLLWKFFVFWVINLWAKVLCYGMPTDSLALVMMFGQIFAIQFATELLFISLSPFGWQFFLILSLKIALNVLVKGRLLEKLNLRLDTWLEKGKHAGTCKARSLIIFIKVCITSLQIFVANAGNRVVHLIAEDGHERLKQRFITHFLYSEMSMLSSVICSIGCATLVGMEILLVRVYPDTFQHRVWTFRSDNPMLYFFGYLTVVVCNILVTIAVTWLLVRDFYALQVIGRFKARVQQTKVFSQVKHAAAKMKHSHAVQQAGRKNLTVEQHKSHTKKLVASSLNVMLREFHKAKMQLHVFERTVFRRHQNFLYFMCFYLTISIVTLLSYVQFKLFFVYCGYDPDNYQLFTDVLNRVVVPTKVQCRFYSDGLNLTNAANVSGLRVVSNLTTVLEQCTFSLTSLWQ